MRRIFTVMSVCLTKLSPTQIKEVVDEIKDPRITDSIMNPLFAFLFEANGGLHNMRFFGPRIRTVTKNGRRSYVNDRSVNPNNSIRSTNDSIRTVDLNNSIRIIKDDPITDAMIKLFPSPAGMITHMTSSKSNFANRFVEILKNKPDTLEYFANFITAIVKGEDKFDDEEGIISMLKLDHIKSSEKLSILEEDTSLYNGNDRDLKVLLLNSEKLSILEEDTSLYNGHDRDFKVLLLNSFIINVLDDPKDLKIYLEYISKKLPDHKSNENFTMKSMLEKSVEIYEKFSFFPYSRINSPQSNITIRGYDRTEKKPLDDKNAYGFSDCADVVLLHLCNCLFYDGVNKIYTLKHLPNNASPELFKFYEKHGSNGIFTITEEIRDSWSIVIQDLRDEEIDIDLFKINTISYVKHFEFTKKDTAEKYLVRNEVKAGFINMMVILMRICGIKQNEIFDKIDVETALLEYGLEKLIKILAMKPNEDCSVEICFENMKKFKIDHPGIQRKEDFAGVMSLTFNYLIENDNLSASVKIYQFSGHAELNLDSINYKIDPVEFSEKTDLMGILYNKYLALVSNRNFESEDVFIDLFLSGKLDTNEFKVECLNKISGFIYRNEINPPIDILDDVDESIHNQGNYTLDVDELRNICKLILGSVELDDIGTRMMFRPYFLYKIELLYKDGIIDVDELIRCWTGASKLKNCPKIQDFWYEKLSEDETVPKMQKLELVGTAIYSSSVEIIAKGLKKFTNLTTLNIRSNSLGKEGVITILDTLKHLPFLTELNISNNRIGDEGATALSEALKELPNLKVLDISCNNLRKEGVVALSEALTKLTTLNISNNALGNDGAIEFSKMGREMKNLESLTIQWNKISEEGLIPIFEALKELPNFKKLDVLYNIDQTILRKFEKTVKFNICCCK